MIEALSSSPGGFASVQREDVDVLNGPVRARLRGAGLLPSPALIHRVSLCTRARDETREVLWSIGDESVDELAGEATATEISVYAEFDHRKKGA